MSDAFTTLAKSLLVLGLLVNAGEIRCQTPSREKLYTSSREQRLVRFEKQADELRKLLKIPGMSAAIVKDQKVLWAKGFGFADLENRVAVTPDTVFHLASITKTFAATLIMQLVEQGKLSLDEPMSRYSTDFKDDSVKIKHIISHTSAGTPGERYQYDGYSYGFRLRSTGKTSRNATSNLFYRRRDCRRASAFTICATVALRCCFKMV